MRFILKIIRSFRKMRKKNCCDCVSASCLHMTAHGQQLITTALETSGTDSLSKSGFVSFCFILLHFLMYISNLIRRRWPPTVFPFSNFKMCGAIIRFFQHFHPRSYSLSPQRGCVGSLRCGWTPAWGKDHPQGVGDNADWYRDHSGWVLRAEAAAPREQDVANNSGSVSTNVARAEMRVVSCQLPVMDLLGC